MKMKFKRVWLEKAKELDKKMNPTRMSLRIALCYVHICIVRPTMTNNKGKTRTLLVIFGGQICRKFGDKGMDNTFSSA